MNPNGISHRLFVAALAQGGTAAKPRPATARGAAARGPAKMHTRDSAPFSVLAARRLTEWSWSGWHHTTL
jgi:hypothetical protein